MAWWTPYLILAIVVGVIALFVYTWKNREQIMAEAGMELPEQLRSKKPIKKQKRPGMNSSKKPKVRQMRK